MSAALTTDAGGTAPAAPSPRGGERYLTLLTWSFTFFNSVRVLAYGPTMATIWASGSSDQHSLLTWLTWLGANATMAAWLYEQNGRRMNPAITVNVCNAVLCAATSLLIVFFRF